MSRDSDNKFSAGPQALGYMYQPRLALLKLIEQPEQTGVIIEGSDDLEFIEEGNKRTLASLKHRAPGTTLTDLDKDFWKSVRIWLDRYQEFGKLSSDIQFYLFTTAECADHSFLSEFVSNEHRPKEGILEKFSSRMTASKAKLMPEISQKYLKLNDEERQDFLSRISIFDASPRIADIQKKLSDRLLRTVRLEHRDAVLERLEGWWSDITIRQISGETTDPIYGMKVSEKLASIADEYRSDNLPITFRGMQPEKIDPSADKRLFVQQLRILDTSMARIQTAIIDYYRAFEQRSSWARENLLEEDEIEQYENTLVEEWKRYKDLIVESLGTNSSEDKLVAAGKEIFKWIEFETDRLRIRERVSEPYVVRGSFHILANNQPEPRVHWHPKFLERIKKTLESAT